MDDHNLPAQIADLGEHLSALECRVEDLAVQRRADFEKHDALKRSTDELKTQLVIILGNVNGISERLDRLEQAHADLVLQYHQGIAERMQQLERHVLNMLTDILPSSTDRITQLEHQVKDYVQEAPE